MAGFDGKSHWVTFKYERLPLFCHFCGLLGHDLRHCALYFATTKNDGEVICQYGDWLKAMGSRTKSPSRRINDREEVRVEVERRKEKSGHVSPNVGTGDGKEPVHCQVQIPVAASMQTVAENPRVVDEVDAENSGPVMDFMQADTILDAN